ncbi:MAG TPA: T9SS type A sorting domain-containing protein, partial [Bacteroidia bacterium]|nr:T9SS type A sorting domain-containing protein [Bacteroidia bacterium]
TYTVKVTDHTGLSQSKTVTVTMPAAISAAMTPGSPSCYGGTNGSLYASVSGGTGPYTYSWSPVAGTSQTLFGLSAGTYTLHITDSHGCTSAQTGTVTQPVVVAATATSVNVTCNGNQNGSASVTATGGDNSYSYSWSPSGGTSYNATGLNVGTYTCHVNDGLGCATTVTVTITQPAILSATTSQTNSTCYMSSNGTATVNPIGGTPPYAFSWYPSGGSGPTATGLTSGMYQCFLSDANGCSVAETLSMTQPTPLSVIIASQTNVLCNGNSTGVMTAQASGATPGYTYTWSPTGGNSATASSLAANTYTCNVKDANGCPAMVTGTITQPSPLLFAPAMSPASCGSSNGTASLSNVTGGTSPYTYSWSPVASSTATVSPVPYGTYTATIKDNYGCTQTTTILVTNSGAPTATATSTNNLCNGASAGSAIASATGGTAPYTYSWSPSGGTAATASGLTAGTYTILVKDASGCFSSASTTLTDPPAITAPITTLSIACNGSNTGTATVNASGGTPSYTYNWSPAGGTNSIASGLVAGVYTCTITDANGCTKISSATVTQATAIAATFSNITPTCYGGNNGIATVTPSGGTPGYVYSWSPSSATTATVSGLSAGTYTCSITDGNGCLSSFTDAISNPAPLIGTVSNVDVSCFSLCDGSASMTTAGGTTPYTYSWSPSGGTLASASNLCAGTYTCFVTDANGCGTQVGALITQPVVLANPLTAVSSSCGGACDGSVTGTTTGGTAPYLYTWSPGTATTASITNACPGTYSCSVVDAHGCTLGGTAVVGFHASPTISGTVTAPVSGNINSGWAYLVQYDSILKRQHIIDSVTISAGHYTFNTSIGTKLLVYAEADHVAYPNVFKTYSKHAVMWDSAAVVNAPCGAIDTANIVMYELPPTTGAGTLAGFVLAGVGYVPHHFVTNPTVQAPGDPIPGLDVNLEQHPGGIVAGHTTTDGSGHYSFPNVPPGNYALWVDIPGLGMTRQYVRTITSNELYNNLDYKVDSAHIRPDSTLGTGIAPQTALAHSLQVAPNPFKDQIVINYNLTSPSDVIIEVYNVLGERIVSTIKTKEDTGSHTYLLKTSESHLSQGSYILRMTMNGIVYSEKIICMP